MSDAAPVTHDELSGGGWVRAAASEESAGESSATVIVQEDESQVRVISRPAPQGSAPQPPHDERVRVFARSADGSNRTVTVRELAPKQ